MLCCKNDRVIAKNAKVTRYLCLGHHLLVPLRWTDVRLEDPGDPGDLMKSNGRCPKGLWDAVNGAQEEIEGVKSKAQ